MPYIKKSVYRAPGNPGVGIKTRDVLSLIDVDDIAFMPAPDDKGVRIVDNIVLKPGAYSMDIYMTPGTVEVTSAADGDIDKIGFTPSVKFEHPGNNLEVREFKTNNINRKFIVIVRYCSGRPADLVGTICNPCKLTPSYTGNNDGNTNEMTLEQISKGEDIFVYEGTIPAEEPVSTVEASATAVAYVADGQYQLSSGSAAITSISGGVDGAVVTLLGCAGTSPSVPATEGKVLLKGGRTFTATAGSQLTLRAFDCGGTDLLWIEQSRHVAS